jgi:hypothetical protein
MIPTLLACMALAGASDEVPSVRTELAHGMAVDWTRGVVSVQAGSYRAGAQAAKAVEQSARLAVDDRLSEELGDVPVTGELDVTALMATPELGAPLSSRQKRWRVVEATYAVSGKVDLIAELSLQDFLKPFTLTLAAPTPPVAPAGAYSGVVLDVRGQGMQPVFVPSVVGPDGAPIWAGQLYDEDAVTVAPCIWVSSPEHPAVAERVGDAPLKAVGERVGEGVIRLPASAAADLRALVGTEALGRGRVVVVTDP